MTVKMEIVSMQVGPLGVNCYLVISAEKNAAVIDPGGNAESILQYLNANGLTMKKILLTHGHIDHIGAVKALKEATNAKIYIHEQEGQMLLEAAENLALLFEIDYEPVSADVLIKDGDCIELDELRFAVLHTPGHTRGSVVFLIERTMFSGDTLFCHSIGRTDFPGGSYQELTESLHKINALDGDYTILSGHGEKTTLNREREENVYLQMLE